MLVNKFSKSSGAGFVISLTHFRAARIDIALSDKGNPAIIATCACLQLFACHALVFLINYYCRDGSWNPNPLTRDFSRN